MDDDKEFRMAMSNAGKGSYAESLAMLDVFLKKKPANFDALLLRAQVHLKLGKPGEALADAESAAVQRPGDYLPHFVKGKALIAMLEFGAAEPEILNALGLVEDRPDDEKIDVLMLLSFCLIMMDEKEEAKIALERLMTLDEEKVSELFQTIFDEFYAGREDIPAEEKIRMQERLNRIADELGGLKAKRRKK